MLMITPNPERGSGSRKVGKQPDDEPEAAYYGRVIFTATTEKALWTRVAWNAA